MSATMQATTRATVFEQRFDALVLRLSHLAKLTPGSTVGRELAEVVGELQRLRRDLSGIDPEDFAAPTPVPEGSQRNLTNHNRRQYEVKNRPGERRCGRHNEGSGAWLPVSAFDVKDKATGQLKTWCRECYKDYQRERYVRVGCKVITVEVNEGDACIGHECPVCLKPFEAGQRIQGESLTHEGCT